MKTTKAEREEAVATLRKQLAPGDTVYTILKHVSRTGMQRVIDVYIIKDNIPLRYSWSVAQACGFTYDKNYEGVKIGGCGMDMGFHLVYSLGCNLFPDGFGEVSMKQAALPSIRPLTKEKAAKAVAIGHQFFGRNGDKSGWDNDGGYALNHRWM